MRKQEKRRERHFLVPVRGSRNLPPKGLATFLLLLLLSLPLLPFFPSQKTAYLSEAVKRIFQRKQRKERCSPSFLPSPSRFFFLSTLLSSGFIHFSPPYPPPFRICYFICTRACLPFARHSFARHDCLPFSSILRCFRHHPIFSSKLRLFVATAQLHLLSRELNVLKPRSYQSNETVQYNCADFNI